MASIISKLLPLLNSKANTNSRASSRAGKFGNIFKGMVNSGSNRPRALVTKGKEVTFENMLFVDSKGHKLKITEDAVGNRTRLSIKASKKVVNNTQIIQNLQKESRLNKNVGVDQIIPNFRDMVQNHLDSTKELRHNILTGKIKTPGQELLHMAKLKEESSEINPKEHAKAIADVMLKSKGGAAKGGASASAIIQGLTSNKKGSAVNQPSDQEIKTEMDKVRKKLPHPLEKNVQPYDPPHYNTKSNYKNQNNAASLAPENKKNGHAILHNEMKAAPGLDDKPVSANAASVVSSISLRKKAGPPQLSQAEIQGRRFAAIRNSEKEIAEAKSKSDNKNSAIASFTQESEIKLKKKSRLTDSNINGKEKSTNTTVKDEQNKNSKEVKDTISDSKSTILDTPLLSKTKITKPKNQELSDSKENDIFNQPVAPRHTKRSGRPSKTNASPEALSRISQKRSTSKENKQAENIEGLASRVKNTQTDRLVIEDKRSIKNIKVNDDTSTDIKADRVNIANVSKSNVGNKTLNEYSENYKSDNLSNNIKEKSLQSKADVQLKSRANGSPLPKEFETKLNKNDSINTPQSKVSSNPLNNNQNTASEEGGVEEKSLLINKKIHDSGSKITPEDKNVRLTAKNNRIKVSNPVKGEEYQELRIKEDPESSSVKNNSTRIVNTTKADNQSQSNQPGHNVLEDDAKASKMPKENLSRIEIEQKPLAGKKISANKSVEAKVEGSPAGSKTTAQATTLKNTTQDISTQKGTPENNKQQTIQPNNEQPRIDTQPKSKSTEQISPRTTVINERVVQENSKDLLTNVQHKENSSKAETITEEPKAKNNQNKTTVQTGNEQSSQQNQKDARQSYDGMLRDGWHIKMPKKANKTSQSFLGKITGGWRSNVANDSVVDEKLLKARKKSKNSASDKNSKNNYSLVGNQKANQSNDKFRVSANNDTSSPVVEKANVSNENAENTATAVQDNKADVKSSNQFQDIVAEKNQQSSNAERTARNIRNLNEVLKKIEGNAKLLNENGKTTIKVNLKPAELGRLLVQIQEEDNQYKVKILTEKPEAAKALEVQTAAVKEALADNGIKVESFEVQSNTERSTSDNQNSKNSDNSTGRRFSRNQGGRNNTQAENELSQEQPKSLNLGTNTVEYVG